MTVFGYVSSANLDNFFLKVDRKGKQRMSNGMSETFPEKCQTSDIYCF